MNLMQSITLGDADAIGEPGGQPGTGEGSKVWVVG
jgi:hypothetical protein